MLDPRREAGVPDHPIISPYGYVPAMANTVAYLTVFSLLTLVHFLLALRYKYYSAIVTMVIGGILEIIGWAGRVWSAKNVLMWDPFIMQTCCLILGPVFFSAWDYTLLGACIKHLGSEYSLIGPNWYLIIFVVADIVSLILQAVGGGGAAVNAENYEDTKTNTHIMLAGIAFQLGVTIIFGILALDFMVRIAFNRPYPPGFKSCFRTKLKIKSPFRRHDDELASPDGEEKIVANEPAKVRNVQIMLVGVAWATLMIIIRGIYRSIELGQGWSGHLITHEVYFIWLDGFLMVLCMAGLAVTHPGFLLPRGGWR